MMAAVQRKSETRKVPTVRNLAPLLPELLAIALTPIQTNKTRNASHTSPPSPPTEANCVGKKPIPNGNATFQKVVELIASGLYMSQSRSNVFGPVPSRASLASDC